MTKITRRPDQAAVAAEVLDLDPRGVVDLQAIAPFDDDRALLGELLEAEVAKLRDVLHAIEIDVGELHPARIHADQLEGWARHRRTRAGALGHAADEGRLARAQLARQEHDIAGAQPFA